MSKGGRPGRRPGGGWRGDRDRGGERKELRARIDDAEHEGLERRAAAETATERDPEGNTSEMARRLLRWAIPRMPVGCNPYEEDTQPTG